MLRAFTSFEFDNFIPLTIPKQNIRMTQILQIQNQIVKDFIPVQTYTHTHTFVVVLFLMIIPTPCYLPSYMELDFVFLLSLIMRTKQYVLLHYKPLYLYYSY